MNLEGNFMSIHCENRGVITRDEYSHCINCHAQIVMQRGNREHTEGLNQTSYTTIDGKTASSRIEPNRGMADRLFARIDNNGAGKEKAIRDVKKNSCPNCGAAKAPHLKFCSNCGRALTIDVAEVLNSTLSILRKRPILIIPSLLQAMVSSWILSWTYLPLQEQLNSTAASSLSLALLWSHLPEMLVSFVAFGGIIVPLVHGMYPVMVKEAMRGEEVDLAGAFRNSLRRFPSLFASYILVEVAVLVGTLALVVPGLILAVWYYYSFPAIMLENRGARDGMSASKAFARDKKWETFMMFLISLAPSIVGSALLRMVPFSMWNGIPHLAIYLFLGVLSGVLSLVMTSYAYLAYAIPGGKSAV
jgi:hypothetical protein